MGLFVGISGTDLHNFTCCHTEIEVVDPTFYLTQSQYTDTGPTSPSADPITPGAWQGSHWSANFWVTGMTRPWTNPSTSGIRTRELPLSRRTDRWEGGDRVIGYEGGGGGVKMGKTGKLEGEKQVDYTGYCVGVERWNIIWYWVVRVHKNRKYNFVQVSVLAHIPSQLSHSHNKKTHRERLLHRTTKTYAGLENN